MIIESHMYREVSCTFHSVSVSDHTFYVIAFEYQTRKLSIVQVTVILQIFLAYFLYKC